MVTARGCWARQEKEAAMRSIVFGLLVCLPALIWQTSQASADFWEWEDREYHIDTVVTGANRQTGAFVLANGMTLDQRIEHFVFVNPVSVGDRVRLVFDDTNYLRRVYRLP
jgi:hypothetical protein